jgi:hypothetical protein
MSTAQDAGQLELSSFEARLLKPQTLLDLPEEILANIIAEWANVQWDAPTTARQVCRWLKRITDNSPRAWSKLFVDGNMTNEKTSKWLTHGKEAPKDIYIDTANISVVLAVLEAVGHATSLIYRIPAPRPAHRLPCKLPKLRHLCLDGSGNRSLQLGDIFAFHGSGQSGYFPCLTVLHLLSFNLKGFPKLFHGTLPTVRQLALQGVRNGHGILGLINAFSGSLEELRVIKNFCPGDFYASRYPRISLPKLKRLVLWRCEGIATYLDAPNLQILYANLGDLDGIAVPFDSVVEWTTRWDFSLRHTSITQRLISMHGLRHLVLGECVEMLKTCFHYLRDNQSVCPTLQRITIGDITKYAGSIKLDNTLKEYLKACIAPRAASIQGFTLEFVRECHQTRQFDLHYSIRVRCLTVMCHDFSNCLSRHLCTNLKKEWRHLIHSSLCARYRSRNRGHFTGYWS